MLVYVRQWWRRWRFPHFVVSGLVLYVQDVPVFGVDGALAIGGTAGF